MIGNTRNVIGLFAARGSLMRYVEYIGGIREIVHTEFYSQN
jgi:hypothetical protein